MISRTTRRFRDAYAALPEHVRAQARAAYRQFQRDPFHPITGSSIILWFLSAL